MSIEQEIRDQIESIKKLKMEVGNINNHLSTLEAMCRGDTQKQVDDAYKRGLEDAWNVARKIAVETDDGGVSISALYEMFGTESMCMIMKNNTVYDVTDKLKAYEEHKDDPIKVGDEVDWSGDKYIVTYLNYDIETSEIKDYDLLAYDGSVADHVLKHSFTKTGRHFDIASILEAMRK